MATMTDTYSAAPARTSVLLPAGAVSTKSAHSQGTQDANADALPFSVHLRMAAAHNNTANTTDTDRVEDDVSSEPANLEVDRQVVPEQLITASTLVSAENLQKQSGTSLLVSVSDTPPSSPGSAIPLLPAPAGNPMLALKSNPVMEGAVVQSAGLPAGNAVAVTDVRPAADTPMTPHPDAIKASGKVPLETVAAPVDEPIVEQAGPLQSPTAPNAKRDGLSARVLHLEKSIATEGAAAQPLGNSKVVAITPLPGDGQSVSGSQRVDVHPHADSKAGDINLPFQVRAQSRRPIGNESVTNPGRTGVEISDAPSLDPGQSINPLRQTAPPAQQAAALTLTTNPSIASAAPQILHSGNLPGTGVTDHVLKSPGIQQSASAAPAHTATDAAIQLYNPESLTVGRLKAAASIAPAAGIPKLELVENMDAAGVPDTANNMFQTLSTGTISAPLSQRSDAAASTLVNAPHSVSLFANDAHETLSSNVKWMADDGVRNAVISLHPRGMGPITVKLEIENEQMNVSFVAAHGGTRDALDAMLPRLRDQLGMQGFDGVRIDVSDGRSDNNKGNQAQQQFGQAREQLAANDQSGANSNKDQRGENTAVPGIETFGSGVVLPADQSMDAFNNNIRRRSLYDAYV
jgi:flagellar hook-length control protein FliK